jgi:hypothetical protein
MSAAELLAELTRRGVLLSVEDEHLAYDAPDGVMQPADFEQLRTHKAELLKVLNHDNRRARANQDIYQARRRADGRGRVAEVRLVARNNDGRVDNATTGVQTGAHASPTERLTDPDGPCETFGSGQYWQLPGKPWYCRQCEPNKPLTATTLTLSCHQPPAPSDSAQTVPDSVFADGLRRTVYLARMLAC